MYISVRVQTDARKETIEEVQKKRLKIAVKEPAERNLANHRVRELIAAYFGVSLGKVRLISGHKSPSKIFDIEQ